MQASSYSGSLDMQDKTHTEEQSEGSENQETGLKERREPTQFGGLTGLEKGLQTALRKKIVYGGTGIREAQRWETTGYFRKHPVAGSGWT